MGVGEHPRSFERAGIARELAELRFERRERLVIAQRGEGDVERIRQHALARQAVVHHLTEYVRVEHIALTKEGEASSERQGGDVSAVDHDLARNALDSIAAAAQGC